MLIVYTEIVYKSIVKYIFLVYIFVAFIPFVGGIILIVLLCKPTKVEYPFNNFNNPQQ